MPVGAAQSARSQARLTCASRCEGLPHARHVGQVLRQGDRCPEPQAGRKRPDEEQGPVLRGAGGSRVRSRLAARERWRSKPAGKLVVRPAAFARRFRWRSLPPGEDEAAAQWRVHLLRLLRNQSVGDLPPSLVRFAYFRGGQDERRRQTDDVTRHRQCVGDQQPAVHDGVADGAVARQRPPQKPVDPGQHDRSAQEVQRAHLVGHGHVVGHDRGEQVDGQGR